MLNKSQLSVHIIYNIVWDIQQGRVASSLKSNIGNVAADVKSKADEIAAPVKAMAEDSIARLSSN